MRGYYAALDEVERLARSGGVLTETTVRRLHTLVVGAGKTRVKPTPCRDGQNGIRDGNTRAIVYLPPEAADVPSLMGELTAWITGADELPVPLKAATE